MRPVGFLAIATATLGLTLHAAAQTPPAAPANAQAVEFFESKVRPLLAQHCYSCHGEKRQQAGLRLDGRDALLKGSDNGPVVVPGDPEKSTLVRAIRYSGELKMPPKGKLPADAVEALTTWVKMGVPWPEVSSSAASRPPADAVAELRKKHWAFQPVQKPPLPAVKNAEWARTPLDRFILARLEAQGLAPSPPADKRTLLRRVTFDLTGLPPTPEEVAAFEADSSPEAFARVVDRLLASPQYGACWARHWLDVARYADTKGYVFTEERRYPYAYTFRDYVIRAFNDDLSYDQFVVQQLAADRLPLGDDKQPLAAMGFLTLGRRFLNNQNDIIDDRIDVVSRGLLGLTVTCARCHDHKFDPIPQKDYYSLAGVFASSTEPKDLPLLAQPERTEAFVAFEKELQAREQKVTEFIQAKHAELLTRFRSRMADYLLQAQEAERSGGEFRDRGRTSGELSPRMVQRWQKYLSETRNSPHPVLAAWHAFAALPAKEFAAQAPAVAARLSADADPQHRVHPLVAQAFADKPPTSLREVAQRYGDLFDSVDKLWQKALQQAKEQKTEPPTALADPDQESLRQFLYDSKNPANVPLAECEQVFDRKMRDELVAVRKRVEEWKATSAGAPPRAMVLADLPSPVTPHVLLRGNPANPGEAVPRQFLQVLAGDKREPFHDGSGRLELARAIASADNPLTARVFVNRVWMYHFGEGLVRTPSNFGLRGDPPTHPELLDYLAATFVEEGWSIKKLHRQILLSNAYQQAGDDRPDGLRIDPENRLLWKLNRRRLDFEALRDSLLAAAGRLDPKIGGPPVDLTTTPFSPRRSVYGFIDRQNLPGLFRTFDFASPDTTSPQRHETTVPQQALFLMNSPFVIEQARHLVARADVQAQKEGAERIGYLYRLLYGRPAEPDEVALGLRFVAEAENPQTAWAKYAQVLLLSNEFTFVD
jgi:mono/diheme cytochrome c family protein